MNKNFGGFSKRAMMGTNLVDRIVNLEQKERSKVIKSLRVLADLLPDLIANRLIVPVDPQNADPEDSAFSGSGMSSNPITIGTKTYSIFDIINGLVNFGVIPGQGFEGAGGAFRVTKDAVYIGDKAVLSTDGLWAIAAQILLSTTNFNDTLSLSGSGGYSALGTGANGAI